VEYTWDFGSLVRFAALWWHGLVVTLGLTALVILAGSVLAAALVYCTRSSATLLRWTARVYIDLFRAIPALVLIGTLYFCLPILISIRTTPFQTAFIALSLNLAPFAAECIRGAVESIPTIQYDSCQVVGLSKWQTQRYVTGPQIVRRAIPSLMGQYITTLKLTSLAASVGVPEIWHVTGQVITTTSLPIEARLTGAALYVVIVLPLVWLSLIIERRLQVRGFGPISER
jgi:His/Glu/Gln/Arg/opine family amino acid ABC transporter permease subunit